MLVQVYAFVTFRYKEPCHKPYGQRVHKFMAPSSAPYFKGFGGPSGP